MMPLDLTRVRELSTAAVRTYQPELRVISVASSYGDGDRIELLLRIAGCHEAEGCLLMVNIGRATEASLETELSEAVRKALDGHRGLPPVGA